MYGVLKTFSDEKDGYMESEIESRALWVFALSAGVSNEQIKAVETALSQRLEDWNSHGNPLCAAVESRENLFLVVSTSESPADVSGCAKDSLHLAVNEAIEFCKLHPARHSDVFYRDESATHVCTRAEFMNLLSTGTVGPKTLVFDTCVQTLSEYNESFELAAGDSWHWSLKSS